MDLQRQDTPPVHIILRYPFKRPADFQPPQLKPVAEEEWSLEEQVWRCLLSLPGPDLPQDILAELEQDEVTFDWELLASTLQVSLSQVFEAASNLFARHLGRPLDIAEESIQYTRNIDREQQVYRDEQKAASSKEGNPISVAAALDDGVMHTTSAPAEVRAHSASDNNQGLGVAAAVGNILQETCNSEPPPAMPLSMRTDRRSSDSLDRPLDASDFDRTGLRSVESLGRDGTNGESVSPAVDLGTATPDNASDSSGGGQNEENNHPQDSDRSMQTASITIQKRNHVPAPDPMVESQFPQKSPANRGPFTHTEDHDDQLMRQSMLADAMGSRFEPSTGYAQARRNTTSARSPPSNKENRRERHTGAQPSNAAARRSSTCDEKQPDSDASSLSFSDLSASSLTESAMQDALLSEAMNASTTMSSILGSRMFPWSKKKKPLQKSRD
ncbi:hypothetical protein EV175_001905 [Coemansia sp. RSA 1933]|nr:hypothetical protein EV175_001905 [Coemansia sp. RSA 1933]